MEKQVHEQQSGYEQPQTPQQILAAEEDQLIRDITELERVAPSHLDPMEVQVAHFARASELAGKRELLDKLKQQF